MIGAPTLAERIKALIVTKGMTVASATRAAEVGPTFIKDILRGRTRTPRADNLNKLAGVLGVTVEQLLDDGTTGARARTVNGFYEPAQATPWVPPPASDGGDPAPFDAMAGAVCPSAAAPSPMQARVAMPFFGILTGDLLIVDLKRPAGQGDIVIVNAADPDTGRGTTLIRRYVPPYLMPPEGGAGGAPQLADGAVNAIMGPVVAVVRSGDL